MEIITSLKIIWRKSYLLSWCVSTDPFFIFPQVLILKNLKNG